MANTNRKIRLRVPQSQLDRYQLQLRENVEHALRSGESREEPELPFQEQLDYYLCLRYQTSSLISEQSEDLSGRLAGRRAVKDALSKINTGLKILPSEQELERLNSLVGSSGQIGSYAEKAIYLAQMVHGFNRRGGPLFGCADDEGYFQDLLPQRLRKQNRENARTGLIEVVHSRLTLKSLPRLCRKLNFIDENYLFHAEDMSGVLESIHRYGPERHVNK